jgi:hypothetical protein
MKELLPMALACDAPIARIQIGIEPYSFLYRNAGRVDAWHRQVHHYQPK